MISLVLSCVVGMLVVSLMWLWSHYTHKVELAQWKMRQAQKDCEEYKRKISEGVYYAASSFEQSYTYPSDHGKVCHTTYARLHLQKLLYMTGSMRKLEVNKAVENESVIRSHEADSVLSEQAQRN